MPSENAAVFQTACQRKPTMFVKTFTAALLCLPLAAEAAADIQRWTTAEGTQILLVERHDNPIVDMEISFKGAGSVFNPEGKNQVAEFTAALLTDGTQTLDEEAFNARANDLAAQIGSDSNEESASVQLRSLSAPDKLQPSLALLNQSLVAPRFDKNVFRRRQQQAVTALQQMETTPDYTASRALTRLVYPHHPYGSGANVTAAGLKNVSLDDIRAFYRTHYAKNNAVVAIVGDINRLQAQQLVQQALRGLPSESRAVNDVPLVVKTRPQRRDIPFAGEQAQIMLGLPLIRRKDADYFALVAGNYILGGGGFDSRLMKVLRDRKGYTYGVRSTLEPATQAGPLTIAYSTQKHQAAASLADAQAVLRQFVTQGPTEAELQQAKANIIGSFPLRFDSNAKLLAYLSLIGVNDLPDNWLETYPQAIAKLTAADVKSAWQRRVNADDFHIVVVGADAR